jgi:hypothetical protein
MSFISRRSQPNFLMLLLGVAAGTCGGLALVTGRFPMPLNHPANMLPFVVRAKDPQLFLFWVLVSAVYFVGLLLLAYVQIDPVENWAAARPEFGRIRSTGRPHPYPANILYVLVSVLVLGVCYWLTVGR